MTIRVSTPEHDNAIMSPEDAARAVVDILQNGGLAVVPLDVSYAFLAGEARALDRIYRLKLRPPDKRCSLLATWSHYVDIARESEPDVARVQRVVEAGHPIGVLTTPRWESATARAIPQECIQHLLKDDKLAVFMNMGGMSEALIAAADAAGMRLFGSSANISGSGNSFSIEEVPDPLLDAVDIVCEAGPCKYANPERLASSIVDTRTGKLTRRGILHGEIEALLHRPHDRKVSAS